MRRFDGKGRAVRLKVKMAERDHLRAGELRRWMTCRFAKEYAERVLCVAEAGSAFVGFERTARSPPVRFSHHSRSWSRIVPHEATLKTVAIRTRNRGLKDCYVLRAACGTMVAERRLECFAHAPVLASDEPGCSKSSGVPTCSQVHQRIVQARRYLQGREEFFEVAPQVPHFLRKVTYRLVDSVFARFRELVTQGVLPGVDLLPQNAAAGTVPS